MPMINIQVYKIRDIQDSLNQMPIDQYDIVDISEVEMI